MGGSIDPKYPWIGPTSQLRGPEDFGVESLHLTARLTMRERERERVRERQREVIRHHPVRQSQKKERGAQADVLGQCPWPSRSPATGSACRASG